jgi:hypothetical protein
MTTLGMILLIIGLIGAGILFLIVVGRTSAWQSPLQSVVTVQAPRPKC